MLYCIGCKLSDGEPESKKTWDIIDVSEFEKLKVFYFLKHFDKSVIVSFFDLSLTNINVNIKMYIFDHLRMYIFAIPPLDRYIFSIDKIFQ